VNAAFLIQRRKTDGPVVTRRRVLSGSTTASHFQWALRWSTWIADREQAASTVLDAKPRSLSSTELRSRARCQDGRWSVIESTLVTLTPFAVEASCPPWFATLLSWCDGQTPARAHLERLRELRLLPASATEKEFATVILELADAGFVELEIFPIPIA
jgi:hypothetical protein